MKNTSVLTVMISKLASRAVKALLFFLLTTCPLVAQEGGYFLSHHKPTGNFDEVSFDILQDGNGVMYVANRTGIIIFDGKHWDFLKTPSAVFALTADDSRTIYTAGRNGFGKLEANTFYNLNYEALSDSSLNNTDIFSVLKVEDKLYGINEEQLFEYDLKTGETQARTPKRGGYLTDLFLLNEKIHVINTVSGILELTDGVLAPTKTKGLSGVFANSVTGFAANAAHILEKEDESLWLLEKDKLNKIPLKPEDENFLLENRIQQIEWLNQDVIAISTLTGGVVFLEPVSGKFLQVLDAESGLSDDEVYFISADSERSLWISHRKGFTRVSPSIPFRSFRGYEGLEGELLNAVTHNETLYVGTSSGLYFLETVEQYENETYLETREIEEIQNKSAEPGNQAEAEQKKNRRGLFGFLRKKQKIDENPVDSSTTEAVVTKRTVTERKIRKKLHSVLYRYKKVPNIDSRVTNVISSQGRLLVSSLDGFFEIKGNRAIQILQEPVRSLYFSAHYKTAFLGTVDNKIRIFNMAGTTQELYLFGGFSNYTTHIFEDKSHRIWFCGTDKMIWVTLEGLDLDETGEVGFDNPFFYETYGAVRNSKVLFINEGGQYELQDNEIVKVSGSRKFVQGAGTEVWILEQEGWTLLGAEGPAEKFELLTVFDSPKYLSLEENHIWLINDQSLLRMARAPNEKISSSYDLLLRGVATDSSNVRPSGKLVVNQDKSALKFEFIKPDYSGIMDIQYQYKLDGLATSKWTDWSADYSTINFPYLPEGDYKLSVRSKDSFGVISNAELISFKVVPPYWKRPWFYALEFTALGLLLIISLRIKRLGYRYRLGSRLLALLILIIIIEFIQTIAENEFQTKSSAIFDFAIQVIMAIIILPLEGLLRKYIFKEKHVKLVDFFKIRDNKDKVDED